jgi:hypothetical protein
VPGKVTVTTPEKAAVARAAQIPMRQLFVDPTVNAEPWRLSDSPVPATEEGSCEAAPVFATAMTSHHPAGTVIDAMGKVSPSVVEPFSHPAV